MSKWIDIKEDMPEIEEKVFFYNAALDKEFYGHFVGDDWGWHSSSGEEFHAQEVVTCWRFSPMPDVPSEFKRIILSKQCADDVYEALQREAKANPAMAMVRVAKQFKERGGFFFDGINAK